MLREKRYKTHLKEYELFEPQRDLMVPKNNFFPKDRNPPEKKEENYERSSSNPYSRLTFPKELPKNEGESKFGKPNNHKQILSKILRQDHKSPFSENPYKEPLPKSFRFENPRALAKTNSSHVSSSQDSLGLQNPYNPNRSLTNERLAPISSRGIRPLVKDHDDVYANLEKRLPSITKKNLYLKDNVTRHKEEDNHDTEKPITQPKPKQGKSPKPVPKGILKNKVPKYKTYQQPHQNADSLSSLPLNESLPLSAMSLSGDTFPEQSRDQSFASVLTVPNNAKVPAELGTNSKMFSEESDAYYQKQETIIEIPFEGYQPDLNEITRKAIGLPSLDEVPTPDQSMMENEANMGQTISQIDRTKSEDEPWMPVEENKETRPKPAKNPLANRKDPKLTSRMLLSNPSSLGTQDQPPEDPMKISIKALNNPHPSSKPVLPENKVLDQSHPSSLSKLTGSIGALTDRHEEDKLDSKKQSKAAVTSKRSSEKHEDPLTTERKPPSIPYLEKPFQVVPETPRQTSVKVVPVKNDSKPGSKQKIENKLEIEVSDPRVPSHEDKTQETKKAVPIEKQIQKKVSLKEKGNEVEIGNKPFSQKKMEVPSEKKIPTVAAPVLKIEEKPVSGHKVQVPVEKIKESQVDKPQDKPFIDHKMEVVIPVSKPVENKDAIQTLENKIEPTSNTLEPNLSSQPIKENTTKPTSKKEVSIPVAPVANVPAPTTQTIDEKSKDQSTHLAISKDENQTVPHKEAPKNPSKLPLETSPPVNPAQNPDQTIVQPSSQTKEQEIHPQTTDVHKSDKDQKTELSPVVAVPNDQTKPSDPKTETKDGHGEEPVEVMAEEGEEEDYEDGEEEYYEDGEEEYYEEGEEEELKEGIVEGDEEELGEEEAIDWGDEEWGVEDDKPIVEVKKAEKKAPDDTKAPEKQKADTSSLPTNEQKSEKKVNSEILTLKIIEPYFQARLLETMSFKNASSSKTTEVTKPISKDQDKVQTPAPTSMTKEDPNNDKKESTPFSNVAHPPQEITTHSTKTELLKDQKVSPTQEEEKSPIANPGNPSKPESTKSIKDEVKPEKNSVVLKDNKDRGKAESKRSVKVKDASESGLDKGAKGVEVVLKDLEKISKHKSEVVKPKEGSVKSKNDVVSPKEEIGMKAEIILNLNKDNEVHPTEDLKEKEIKQVEKQGSKKSVEVAKSEKHPENTITSNKKIGLKLRNPTSDKTISEKSSKVQPIVEIEAKPDSTKKITETVKPISDNSKPHQPEVHQNLKTDNQAKQSVDHPSNPQLVTVLPDFEAKFEEISSMIKSIPARDLFRIPSLYMVAILEATKKLHKVKFCRPEFEEKRLETFYAKKPQFPLLKAIEPITIEKIEETARSVRSSKDPKATIGKKDEGLEKAKVEEPKPDYSISNVRSTIISKDMMPSTKALMSKKQEKVGIPKVHPIPPLLIEAMLEIGNQESWSVEGLDVSSRSIVVYDQKAKDSIKDLLRSAIPKATQEERPVKKEMFPTVHNRRLSIAGATTTAGSLIHWNGEPGGDVRVVLPPEYFASKGKTPGKSTQTLVTAETLRKTLQLADDRYNIHYNNNFNRKGSITIDEKLKLDHFSEMREIAAEAAKKNNKIRNYRITEFADSDEMITLDEKLMHNSDGHQHLILIDPKTGKKVKTKPKTEPSEKGENDGRSIDEEEELSQEGGNKSSKDLATASQTQPRNFQYYLTEKQAKLALSEVDQLLPPKLNRSFRNKYSMYKDFHQAPRIIQKVFVKIDDDKGSKSVDLGRQNKEDSTMINSFDVKRAKEIPQKPQVKAHKPWVNYYTKFKYPYLMRKIAETILEEEKAKEEARLKGKMVRAEPNSLLSPREKQRLLDEEKKKIEWLKRKDRVLTKEELHKIYETKEAPKKLAKNNRLSRITGAASKQFEFNKLQGHTMDQMAKKT